MTKELFKHMHWADAKIWNAVLATPDAENEPKIEELLYHIHLCQHAYLKIWSKQPLDFPPESSFENLEAIAQWGADYHEGVGACIDGFTPNDLQKPLDVPWLDEVENMLGRPPEPATLAETMLQITLHSTHHRGQLQTLLRQLGTEPPLVDFVVWVWLGKPPAEWPDLSASKREAADGR